MFCRSVLCKIPCYLLQPKKSMPWKYLMWKQLTNALAKDSFWKKLTKGFGQRPVTDLTGCSVGAHHPEKWFQRQRSWVKGVAISHGDPTPGLYQLDLENMCGSVGLRVASPCKSSKTGDWNLIAEILPAKKPNSHSQFVLHDVSWYLLNIFANARDRPF